MSAMLPARPAADPLPPRKIPVWIPVLLCVVVLGLLMLAFIRTAHDQAQLDRAIDELDVPADWALVEENRRSPDFAGLCVVGAFDVRTCDEALLRYEVSTLPRSEQELMALLPAAAWRKRDGDCSDPRFPGGGLRTVCSLETSRNGFRVSAVLTVRVSGGEASHATVDVLVTREE